MRVSIITATWNVANTLGPTLESIRNQDYPDLELIIVDGGSTDGTLTLARSFSGPQVTIISEPDRGIYDAMNKGVRLASGTYVNFMNAGDRFAGPGVVAEVVKGIAETKVDYAYGNVLSVYGKGEKLSVARPPEFIWRNKPFNHQALFARRSWLEDIPFDLKYSLVADYNQTYAAYRAGAKLRRLPLTIARVNMADGASKRNYWRMVREKTAVNWRHSDNKIKTAAYLMINLPFLGALYLLRRLGVFNTLMSMLGRWQRQPQR